ncbi:MAG: hypothetical protein EA401_06715 [Planctomycetota bacterium]|nr:MAG: hypothetical protein EA401_06715 [Planctomycetota bacterium]
MDFYIGNERGDLVTATITEKIDANLIILGYSTASYGSQAIVAQGGYDMVRKHNNARGINPSLLEWLKTAGNRLLA